MSQEHYELKLDTLQTIANAELAPPNRPVDTALQEAENLFVWAQADQAALEGIGFDWATWGADLPLRTGALRYAQSLWVSERHTKDQAEMDWKNAAPAAYELRDDLLASFRYAFRKREDLLNRVREISEGSGNADMIQDLSDLSALGKANMAELDKIKFDPARLDFAATQADQLADMLALANGTTQDTNQAKLLRDAAFAHLKEAVDEIRTAGKYAFRKQKDRYQGYTSQYHKK
ncbi:hypothetical protein [uncultured Microscilla sp.]|uniref:hypothetical protein n=1 Tax=uncultured Microscilla sp. TaxID=432653 RepID=UPI0026329957|nr:hypothetical protein [uncultured Microscilla sp.]